ncbi:cytochrome P450-dit2 [Allomyces arbusculus]|nr:cytochrome P450-dit2 [Allomyces arbusculus]
MPAYLRSNLRGDGFLNWTPELLDLTRKDAMRKGLIKSMDETPDVFLMWLVGTWFVHLANPEDAKLLYTQHELFEMAVISDGLGSSPLFFGRNMFSVPTPEWKHHRKVVNPAFSRGWDTSFFGEPARNLISELDVNAVSGKTIDSADWMQRMTLDGLTLAAFGTSLDAIRHPNGDMVATYNAILKSLSNFRELLHPWYEHPAVGKRAQGRLGQENGEDDDNDRRDLLEMMIQAAEGSDFTREDLRSNMAIFSSLDVHDTTANELRFAIYLMGLNKDVQTKARAEVIRIMGEDTARRATTCDAADMAYPTSEQERAFTYLNSVAKLPRRKTTAPVTLSNGVKLPAGIPVTVDTYALQRDKAVYGPDADEFKPDRWASTVGKDGIVAMHPPAHNYTWAPFGGGQRICIGMQFSLAEQRVVLAMLLLRYEWDVVGNAERAQGRAGHDSKRRDAA